MNSLLSVPRTLMMLAGFLVEAVTVLARGSTRPSGERQPWLSAVADLGALLDRQQHQISALAEAQPWGPAVAELHVKLDGHQHQIAALAQAEPWSHAITGLDAKLAARIADLDTKLVAHQFQIAELEARPGGLALEPQLREATSSFARKDEVAAMFEAQDGRLHDLEGKVDEHHHRLDSVEAMVAALEHSVSVRVLRLETRLQAHLQSLEQMSAKTEQSTAAFRHAVDSIEAFRRSPETERLKLSAGASGPLSSLVDEDAAVARMFHVRL